MSHESQINARQEAFDRKLHGMPDEELIAKVDEWNLKLCESRGEAWALSIPPNPTRDPDILIGELCRRYEMKIQRKRYEFATLGEDGEIIRTPIEDMNEQASQIEDLQRRLDLQTFYISRFEGKYFMTEDPRTLLARFFKENDFCIDYIRKTAQCQAFEAFVEDKITKFDPIELTIPSDAKTPTEEVANKANNAKKALIAFFEAATMAVRLSPFPSGGIVSKEEDSRHWLKKPEAKGVLSFAVKDNVSGVIENADLKSQVHTFQNRIEDLESEIIKVDRRLIREMYAHKETKDLLELKKQEIKETVSISAGLRRDVASLKTYNSKQREEIAECRNQIARLEHLKGLIKDDSEFLIAEASKENDRLSDEVKKLRAVLLSSLEVLLNRTSETSERQKIQQSVETLKNKITQ